MFSLSCPAVGDPAVVIGARRLCQVVLLFFSIWLLLFYVPHPIRDTRGKEKSRRTKRSKMLRLLQDHPLGENISEHDRTSLDRVEQVRAESGKSWHDPASPGRIGQLRTRPWTCFAAIYDAVFFVVGATLVRHDVRIKVLRQFGVSPIALRRPPLCVRSESDANFCCRPEESVRRTISDNYIFVGRGFLAGSGLVSAGWELIASGLPDHNRSRSLVETHSPRDCVLLS